MYYIAMPWLPAATVPAFPVHPRAVYNKWYFDELYDACIVQPALRIGRFFWKRATAPPSTVSAPTISPRAPRTWRAC